MPPIRPFMNAGARWAYSLGDLADVRARHAVTGAPTIVRNPWSGCAIRFDGTNDYVTLVAQEFPLRFDSGTQDFSVAAWVRRGASGADHTIISKEDGADDGWIFRFLSTNAIQMKVNAASAGGPSIITDELWHCVVGVVDRSASLYVYLDGTPGAGVAIAGPAMATTTAPMVGARTYDLSGKYEGDIDSIAVWDRVLSAAECLQLAGVA